MLIRQHLPDSLANGDAGFFQLEHCHSDSVHIQHQIGPLGRAVVIAQNGNLFRDMEIIVFDVVPVDIMHGDAVSALILEALTAVAQGVVDILANLIEGTGLIARFRDQTGNGLANDLLTVAALSQIPAQKVLHYGLVAQGLQTPQKFIVEFMNQPAQNAVLQLSFAVHRHFAASFVSSNASARSTGHP